MRLLCLAAVAALFATPALAQPSAVQYTPGNTEFLPPVLACHLNAGLRNGGCPGTVPATCTATFCVEGDRDSDGPIKIGGIGRLTPSNTALLPGALEIHYGSAEPILVARDGSCLIGPITVYAPDGSVSLDIKKGAHAGSCPQFERHPRSRPGLSYMWVALAPQGDRSGNIAIVEH